MAYTRVNWEDLPSTNTPRNADNLNNMDSGIKENDDRLNGTKPMGSIIVDDINCKNMWIPTLYVGNTQILQTRCNVTLSGDTYSFTATGTDIFIGNVWTTIGNDYNGTLGTLYKVKPNTSYTLSCSNSNFSKNFITFYGSDKKSLSYQELTSNVATFTTPNNCEYITIRIGNGSATSGTTYTTTIQLEEGSTATDFVPYKQPVKITNVGVKESTTFYADDFKCRNLFDPISMIELNGQVRRYSDGVIVSVSGYYGIKVPVSANTTYTISSNLADRNKISNLCYFNGTTYISGEAFGSGSLSFTTPNNCNYITFALSNEYTWCQLEVGSEATPYTPYKNFDNTLIISPLLSDTTLTASTSYALSDAITNYKYIMLVLTSAGNFENANRQYIPVEQIQEFNNLYRCALSVFQSTSVYMFADMYFADATHIYCNTVTRGTTGWAGHLKVYGIK